MVRDFEMLLYANFCAKYTAVTIIITFDMDTKHAHLLLKY